MSRDTEIEITEGVFEILSRTRNVQENVMIFDKFLHKFSPSKWAKSCDIFLNISGSRPNLKDPFDYFINRVCHTKIQGPVTFPLGSRGLVSP
jgi:hypothetical protein